MNGYISVCKEYEQTFIEYKYVVKNVKNSTISIGVLIQKGLALLLNII